MRLSRRRRKRPAVVTFQDEHGAPMSLWQVRAGMLVIKTDYAHGPASLTVRVRPERRLGLSDRRKGA